MSLSKRAPKKTPRTAIVPRVVFQTAIAVSVIPVAAGALAGCNVAGVAAVHDAGFSVAMPRPDARIDAAFSVADVGFSVADVGFSVADVGFSVAAPLDAPAPDAGFFSVAIEAPDAGNDTDARG